MSQGHELPSSCCVGWEPLSQCTVLGQDGKKMAAWVVGLGEGGKHSSDAKMYVHFRQAGPPHEV